MLDKNAYLLRKYHATGNVVYRSVGTILNSVHTSTEWGTCLHQFNVATKQFEALWDDMDPLFSLVVPVPKKIPTEGDSIPNLLNSSIGKTNTDALLMPQSAETDVAGAKAVQDTKAKLVRHNEAIDGLLDDIQEYVEKEKAAAVSAKRQRRK